MVNENVFVKFCRLPATTICLFAWWIVIISACAYPSASAQEASLAPKSILKFLALGDSYTIGESVEVKDRWPSQLKQLLEREDIALEEPVIIAKTGWTTDELDAAIDSANPENEYDLVTLLIGVNNQYRQRPVETYAPEFERLLLRAIEFAKGEAHRVIVVSIPDYGITPFVTKKFAESPNADSKFSASRIANELDAYNLAAKEITIKHEANWVDITPLSRKHGLEPGMLAEDGLHPSGLMYKLWAKEVTQIAKQVLNKH